MTKKRTLLRTAKLRRELDLHDPCAPAASQPEYLRRVVQGGTLEACVDDLFDHLPHNLKQANPTEVPGLSLGDQKVGWLC